jgi:hypothetical protein
MEMIRNKLIEHYGSDSPARLITINRFMMDPGIRSGPGFCAGRHGQEKGQKNVPEYQDLITAEWKKEE